MLFIVYTYKLYYGKGYLSVVRLDLTFFGPLEFPIKFATVESGWSIVYV